MEKLKMSRHLDLDHERNFGPASLLVNFCNTKLRQNINLQNDCNLQICLNVTNFKKQFF